VQVQMGGYRQLTTSALINLANFRPMHVPFVHALCILIKEGLDRPFEAAGMCLLP
jgi:hypothetical protein